MCQLPNRRLTHVKHYDISAVAPGIYGLEGTVFIEFSINFIYLRIALKAIIRQSHLTFIYTYMTLSSGHSTTPDVIEHSRSIGWNP